MRPLEAALRIAIFQPSNIGVGSLEWVQRAQAAMLCLLRKYEWGEESGRVLDLGRIVYICQICTDSKVKQTLILVELEGAVIGGEVFNVLVIIGTAGESREFTSIVETQLCLQYRLNHQRS